jgi:Protease inhibitor Inh
MQLKSGGLAAAALAGLILGGCQSSRISGIDTYSPAGPAPVTAAPAGTIQQSQLPAPTSPAPVVATDPSQFPTAPTSPDAPATDGTQIAAASGPDVTVGSVAGVWSVSTGGGACKVATPQTKYGQGFRAGPLKCPGDMANVKSWNVAGKQLVFYDESGGKIATLYQSSPGKFDGQTTGGSAVSLSR